MTIHLRAMKITDAIQVGLIDKECFSTMLPTINYGVELLNPMAHYLVAVAGEMNIENSRSAIWGFAGIWLMAGEAHLINIAVREEHRGCGIGELLLIGILQVVQHLRASIVTLEVRVSNIIAQQLYKKYGFSERGRRRAYYTDNREDALIMTLDHPDSVNNENLLRSLRQCYKTRWGRSTEIETDSGDSP
jgi:ribosomal-protein-alanine N-acetyltransferase